jgi:peptidoglycan/xylan/chitin deacetylase (PgdA/CDA1 family)
VSVRHASLLAAIGMTLALAAMAVGGFRALGLDSSAVGVSRVECDERVVALTFDDGPDPEFTPDVLDLLEEYEATATFFMVGKDVEAYPALVRRVVRAGHELGNHTYSHPQMDELATGEFEAELERQEGAVAAACDAEQAWYRPPRREMTRAQRVVASEMGLDVALWTHCLETTDEDDLAARARSIAEDAEPGDIILLHDGRLDRTTSVEALPALLDGLDERGFRMVSLSELVALGG